MLWSRTRWRQENRRALGLDQKRRCTERSVSLDRSIDPSREAESAVLSSPSHSSTLLLFFTIRTCYDRLIEMYGQIRPMAFNARYVRSAGCPAVRRASATQRPCLVEVAFLQTTWQPWRTLIVLQPQCSRPGQRTTKIIIVEKIGIKETDALFRLKSTGKRRKVKIPLEQGA
jgi:hypothetical protein